MSVRFALVNVHPPEIGLKAMDAFDLIVDGRAVGDTESRTGLGTRAQEPASTHRGVKTRFDSRPVGKWREVNVRPAVAYHHQSGP